MHMDLVTTINAIGQYGLPTVCAAVILILFVRGQARSDARADRLENRLLGNGDATRPGKLQEIHSCISGLRAENEQQHTQIEASVTDNTARLDEGQKRMDAIQANCAKLHPAQEV